MSNRYVHGVDLQTQNPTAAKAFYGGLFNWTFEDIPQMNYSRFGMPDAEGGVMQSADANSPARWVPYFSVDKVAATTAKAKSLGARIAIDATEIPGHGWFALVADPTGAIFGLWQSVK